MAAPDAKTPPLDAAVPLQRGDIVQEGSETGDSFSCVGRGEVSVGGAGRTLLVAPPVSGD